MQQEETTPEKPGKADKATIQQRVNEILVIRLAGAEFPDIVQYASEKEWGVGERQLRNYLRQSDALLAESLETDRTKLINRHIAQRRALFARCMAVSDYSNARQVLKDEAELLGLYPAKRTELTGKDGGPITLETVELTEDERRAAIAAILAEDAQVGMGETGGGSNLDGQGDAAGSGMEQSLPGDDPGECFP